MPILVACGDGVDFLNEDHGCQHKPEDRHCSVFVEPVALQRLEVLHVKVHLNIGRHRCFEFDHAGEAILGRKRHHRYRNRSRLGVEKGGGLVLCSVADKDGCVCDTCKELVKSASCTEVA